MTTKCKVKDPNSDSVFEVSVDADISGLSENDQAELQQETVRLAKLYAFKLGYFTTKDVDSGGKVIE